jgi:hypothetical protein
MYTTYYWRRIILFRLLGTYLEYLALGTLASLNAHSQAKRSLYISIYFNASLVCRFALNFTDTFEPSLT